MNPATADRRPRSRAAIFALCLAVTATIGIALAMIDFAAPVDDDFVRAAPSVGRDWFGYVIRYSYFRWTGRWAEVGLSAFVLPRVDPTRHYAALLVALAVVQFLGLWLFWEMLDSGQKTDRRQSARRQATRRRAAQTAGSFALIWAASPAPGETYYWFSGNVDYSLNLSLSLVLFAALIRVARARGRGAAVAGAVACAAFAFAIGGMHELLAACLCVALGAGAAVAFRARARSRAVWAVVFVAAVAGFLVPLLAPGNAVRAAHLPGGGNPVIAARSIVKITLLHVIPWMFDPRLLAATALLLLGSGLAPRRLAWPAHPAVPWRWLLPALTAAMVFIWVAGPSWAMGGINGRALNAAHMIFFLGWCATALAWRRELRLGARMRPGVRLKPAARRRARLAAAWALAASLLLTGNGPRAAADLARHAPAWRRAKSRQFELAREGGQAGAGDLTVPALPPRPALFHSDGLAADPADWRNRGFAGYFGLRSVRVAPPGAAAPAGD